LSSPTPQTSTTSQGDEAIASRIEVELDIFSGNPNPAWTLSDADSAQFLEKLATLPAASPAEFDTNLGYRGFIVRIANATESSVVRIQRGMVHVLRAGKDLYYSGAQRDLERWLLRTGQPFLDSTIFGIVETALAK
jgi:hypothetical protein